MQVDAIVNTTNEEMVDWFAIQAPKIFKVFREQKLIAVLNDGASGNDADKRILIIHHRHKILRSGPRHQFMHGGGDPNRQMIPPPGDLHDPPGLRLTHIHVANIFEGPQQVSLCQRAPIFAPLIQDRQRREACLLHFFQRLPDGIVIV